MKKLNEPFSSPITQGPSVRISSTHPNSSYRAEERNNKNLPETSRSMQLPARALSGTELLVTHDPILKTTGDQSFHSSSNYQYLTKSSNKGVSITQVDRFAKFPQSQPPMNVHPLNLASAKKAKIISPDIEDDLIDDDTTDTLSLRNNLTTKVMTEGRFNLFNNKIQQFNDEKNRGNQQSSMNSSITTRSHMEGFRPSVRVAVGNDASTLQGPKNYFPTELNSPAPKENSFDSINEMLDFSGDEGSDQHPSLDDTQKIPLKDYLEISQAFEKSGIDSPGRETLHLSRRKLLSGENMDDSENLDLPDSAEGDKAINANMLNILRDGTNNIKLLEAEEEKQMTESEAMEALIKAIFEHQVENVIKLIKKYPTLLNQQDALGNTPLNLTVKLAYKHLDYFPIAKFMLFQGANPKIKDINGWSCLDEVICQADVMLLSVLFDHLINFKKKVLIKQQEKLLGMLNLTPDFYLEMKWDFESSIIPFFSKLAPSDTFKIWKYRKYLRMDSTLAGFKRLSIKRRDMSLIFNPDIVMPQGIKAGGSLFNVNRTKSQYTNPLQEVNIEEKKYMMYDMLKADPLQGTFNIKGCQWHEHKGIFGHGSSVKVNDWETKRLDFRLDMEYTLFKKAKVFFQETYDSYQNKLTTAKSLPNQRLTGKDPKEILNQLKQRNGGVVSSNNKKTSTTPKKNPTELKIEKINLDTFENAQVTEKKAEASIWLARNFPMKFDALLPVIEFLSNGNNLLQRVESLLSREEVKSVISENAFPVKIQVPITLSIKANITITKYELVKDPDVQDLFFIPKNFNYVDRKDAQKTLMRTKKRMVLVNVLT